MTDKHLLDRYVADKNQAAFAELAERHMGMVYATCRRDLMDQQLAEDATQVVFVLLAMKSPMLTGNVSIPGWLFITARNVSRGMLRVERRRKRHEREAVMSLDKSHERENAWNEIEPALNDALSTLQAADRDIVLKRFFQGLSVRELANEIGTTEDTAAKRLSRAIDRLRRYFQAQEVTVTSATLAALLLEHAVLPVPSKVAAVISGVPQSPGGSSVSTAKAHSPYSILAKGLFVMSTTKIAGGIGLVVLLVLLAGFGIYHHSRMTPIAANPAVLWSVPRAADPGSQTAQHQIYVRFEQYMQAWNTYSAPAILANLSPDFTMINPGGGKPTTYQDFARFLPNALATATPGRSTTVKINSCQISGNTAVLAVEEFHHSSANDKPFEGDTDNITVTMIDTGGRWLISHIGP